MGVIDTISEGFRAATRKVWIAAIPAILDLFLWLGPKISIAPLMNKAATIFRTAADAIPQGAEVTGNTDMIGMMVDLLENTLGQFNLLSFLAWGRLGVPSLAGRLLIEEGDRWVFEVTEYWQMVGLQLIILAAGLLIACAFLTVLAQQITGGTASFAQWVQRVLRSWVYMAVVFVPLTMAMVFALSFSLILGPFGVFTFVLVLWVALYITFVPQAITLGGQRPLSALASSFTVVRFGFWPTLLLVLLINVISTGLGLIWQQLVSSSAIATLVAILANAYIGTGLTMAMFIFFRNRIALLQQTLQNARNV